MKRDLSKVLSKELEKLSQITFNMRNWDFMGDKNLKKLMRKYLEDQIDRTKWSPIKNKQ